MVFYNPFTTELGRLQKTREREHAFGRNGLTAYERAVSACLLASEMHPVYHEQVQARALYCGRAGIHVG